MGIKSAILQRKRGSKNTRHLLVCLSQKSSCHEGWTEKSGISPEIRKADRFSGLSAFCWLLGYHSLSRKSTASTILMPSWSWRRSHSMAMTIFRRFWWRWNPLPCPGILWAIAEISCFRRFKRAWAVLSFWEWHQAKMTSSLLHGCNKLINIWHLSHEPNSDRKTDMQCTDCMSPGESDYFCHNLWFVWGIRWSQFGIRELFKWKQKGKRGCR